MTFAHNYAISSEYLSHTSPALQSKLKYSQNYNAELEPVKIQLGYMYYLKLYVLFIGKLKIYL